MMLNPVLETFWRKSRFQPTQQKCFQYHFAWQNSHLWSLSGFNQLVTVGVWLPQYLTQTLPL